MARLVEFIDHHGDAVAVDADKVISAKETTTRHNTHPVAGCWLNFEHARGVLVIGTMPIIVAALNAKDPDVS